MPTDCSVDISGFHNPTVCLRGKCRRTWEECRGHPLWAQNTNMHTQSIVRLRNWHGSYAENARSILSVLQRRRRCEICDTGCGLGNSAAQYCESSMVLVERSSMILFFLLDIQILGDGIDFPLPVWECGYGMQSYITVIQEISLSFFLLLLFKNYFCLVY